jgi:hypothetical protein
MAELKDSKRKNGKLSLYPLKFEEAVKAVVGVKSKPPMAEKTERKRYNNGHQGNREPLQH